MKDIKGIILAGGAGTRLYPLTKVTNKHLLPIGGEPMIFHPLRKLVESGIKEIMIVTGVEYSSSITSLLGSGKDYGCNFTYRVQDQPDGIAGALNLCRNFVGDSSCVVLLGDNIFKEDLKPHIDSFIKNSEDSNKVFDIIQKVEISERGEYEITGVNNLFLEKHVCDYVTLKERWVDAGTMDSYHKTNWLVYKES